MSYQDALTDTTTLYSLNKTVEATGEEVISLEEEYADEPCRLMKGGYGVPRAQAKPGQFEDPRGEWTMLLNPSVTGVQKGWRALCNSIELIVTEIHEVKGTTQDVHHVVLFLQEKT